MKVLFYEGIWGLGYVIFFDRMIYICIYMNSYFGIIYIFLFYDFVFLKVKIYEGSKVYNIFCLWL